MLPASPASISPREAKKEQDRRKLARAKFLYFCKYTDPKFEDAAHMTLIANKLEQVARYLQTGGKGGIGRLMILMPPRHGKSEMASRKFPGWLLGKLPDTRIIMTSYGADLASKNSRAVRDLIESKRYQALFGGLSSMNEPVELSSDSRSVAAWDLAQPHRGGVVAAGVGGGITGLGADVLIGDDLVKNREEAESEPRRELVDDWWKSSAHTRLEKEYAAIILFFTHWHVDDQVGRLIKRMVEDPKADQWDILMLPALALGSYSADAQDQRKKMRDGVFIPIADPLGRKPGEALWPSRFSREWLLQKKSNVGIYDFDALYQQLPYAKEGNMFKRDWFTVVDHEPGPAVWARIRAWDKAATPGGGARSAGVKMSWGLDDYIYVEHVKKDQVSSAERDKMIVETGKRDYALDGPFLIWHPQDPGSAGLDSARATNGLLAENGLIGTFDQVTGDKATNAGPFSTMAEAGRVRLVHGGWNEEYLDEMQAFPKGSFKDQGDASASAYNQLRGIVEILKQAAEDDDTLVVEERVEISPV
jgi:predicted phage terminase large subunit-like protein